VWIFTRTGTIWAQQGNKMSGNDAIGAAQQGISVALSGDGNTFAFGGSADNSGIGAVWIFMRSGTVWSQLTKLTGAGVIGASGTLGQGISVALSADGNTLAEGGISDNGARGAVWVFTRTGTVWSQQGAKLTGLGASGQARQGASVALSADGNTLAEGGYGNTPQASVNLGAVWVFTRAGTLWSQQGGLLTGSGSVGAAQQGASVALSADGNTLAEAGFADNSQAGAIWIFTRSGTVWQQQGTKLTGSGAIGNARQGISVALSADGNMLAEGASNDNTQVGAAWLFTRDAYGAWTQLGTKLTGSGAVGASQQGQSIALSADATTMAVGGIGDNSFAGAVWVFV
jgi:hypothetical protein